MLQAKKWTTEKNTKDQIQVFHTEILNKPVRERIGVIPDTVGMYYLNCYMCDKVHLCKVSNYTINYNVTAEATFLEHL